MRNYTRRINPEKPSIFDLRGEMLDWSKKRNAAAERLTELLTSIGVDKVKLKGSTEAIELPPCKTDADCPEELPKCDNGICVIPLPEITKCTADSDCEEGEKCVKGECVPTEVPPEQKLPPGVMQGFGAFDTEAEARDIAKQMLEQLHQQNLQRIQERKERRI